MSSKMKPKTGPAKPVSSQAKRIFKAAQSSEHRRKPVPSEGVRKRVFVGIVAFKNSDVQLARVIRSIEEAIKVADCDGEIHMIGNDFVERNSLPTSVAYSTSKNVGFGVSHNVLMSQAFHSGFDYYLCINPDGFLHYDALGKLLLASVDYADDALVEAVQVPVQHPKPFDPISLDTPWVSGACFLIPKKIYDTIGGFDEQLFMYCEDVDISWRAKYAGFQLKVEPRAMFYHDVSGRTRNVVLERQLMLSGRYIAEKYSCPDFRGWVEDAMLANQLIRDKRALPNVHVQDHLPLDPSIVEFRNAFHFSFPRW